MGLGSLCTGLSELLGCVNCRQLSWERLEKQRCIIFLFQLGQAASSVVSAFTFPQHQASEPSALFVSLPFILHMKLVLYSNSS